MTGTGQQVGLTFNAFGVAQTTAETGHPVAGAVATKNGDTVAVAGIELATTWHGTTVTVTATGGKSGGGLTASVLSW